MFYGIPDVFLVVVLYVYCCGVSAGLHCKIVLGALCINQGFIYIYIYLGSYKNHSLLSISITYMPCTYWYVKSTHQNNDIMTTITAMCVLLYAFTSMLH